MSAATRGPGTIPSMSASRSAQLRLLHVHAHPDDESSKGADLGLLNLLEPRPKIGLQRVVIDRG